MQGEKIDERDGTKATTVVKGIRRRRKKTNARGKKREFTFYTLDARFDPSGKLFLSFQLFRSK